MITLRLEREMNRNILVPVIIDVEYDTESVKEALREVTSQKAIGSMGGLARSLGAPELLDAYLKKGYVHDIKLPSFSLLSTFSTKEAIEKLSIMPNVRNIHFDMNKSAPPKLPYLPSAVFAGFGFLGGERTEGWFGTKDVHKLLGVDVAHAGGYTAKDIKIAVIDTGVHKHHRQLLKTRTRATTVLPGGRLLERAVGDTCGHGCIHGDAKVITSYCGLEKISTLFDNMEQEYGSTENPDGSHTIYPEEDIYTVGYGKNGAEKTKVSAVHKIPIHDKVIEIINKGGTFITTRWHPFLIHDRRGSDPRYIRADEIKKSMSNCYNSFVIPDKTISLSTEYKTVAGWTIDEKIGYLLGLMWGDGHLGKKRTGGRQYCLLSAHNKDRDKIIILLNELNIKYYIRKKRSDSVDFEMWRLRILLRELGFPEGKKIGRLKIPKQIVLSPKTVIFSFIAGLIDSDGSFGKDRPRMRFVNSDKEFVEDLVCLFMAIGIDARIYTHKALNRTRVDYPNIKDTNDMYVATVTGRQFRKLLQKVGPYLRLKEPAVMVGGKGKYHDLRKSRIREFDFDGYFYDFTTETENYLAGQKGMTFIHNTWCVTSINGTQQEVMEGIIVEGLSDANVLSIRALFTPLGTGKDSDILKAMSMAYEDEVDIISMSLGGECEGPDCLTCAAVRDLSAKNIIMVIAAGNEGLPDSVACPGKEMEAVTVGSVSITDRNIRSHFSSMGPAVDCALYGGGRASVDTKPEEYIYSGTSPYSLMDALIDHKVSGYGLLLGTSMSTPMMAAMVALWDDYYYKATGYYLTPVDVHTILQHHGHSHSNEDGYGVPQFNWIRWYVSWLKKRE